MAEQDPKARVCVVGAAGYAGAELCRYILGHPALELTMVTARAEAAVPLSTLYPGFLGLSDIVLEAPDPQEIARRADFVFLAVPHTAAFTLAPKLLAANVCVIDLSADFRLKDQSVYEEWYGVSHDAPELLAHAVYGLPELNRPALSVLAERHQKGEPVLVAAPGCYPTAAALALVPALQTSAWISSPVIVDAISGVSGAGRAASARTHFCHADESVEAYGVTRHRHTPEIAQSLAWAAGREVPLVFTPHLGPYKRGILATCYLSLVKGATTLSKLREIYEAHYGEAPLVELLSEGTQPNTASVAGSAKAQIALALDEATSTLVATCAIDNLGKGAAAQAIQCANVILGLPEETGLLRSLPPVV